MNKTKLMRVGSMAIFALVVFIATVTPAFAYEEDTHFLMTYVICRAAGMTEDEALTVAAVDQGMDDSKDTNAIDKGPNVTEQWLWHAIDKGGDMKAAGILGRRDALFNDAVNERDARIRLIRLGIFFHFQQDSWAHRRHDKSDKLSRDNYTPVTTPEGHGPWGHQPDRPPFDPAVALLCLEDGILYATDFVRRGLGRQPNVFFKDYKNAGLGEDDAWKDDRKGKYFNQLDVAGLTAGSAKLYLASLIRSQIDTYKTGKTNGPFLGFNTAEKADLNKVADAFEKVCDDFKSVVGTIRLPTQAEKKAKGFDKMTTVMLVSLRPGSM